MARSLVLLMVLVVCAPVVLAVEGDERGHWEILGEDGAIWVPDEPVASAYLPPPSLGAFHNHSELTAALQALAAAYPALVTLESLGDSVEGRAVWAVTLRAGPDGGRPAVLFDGAHHGDEVIASEILVRYAQELAAEYPSTPRSREILENTTVVIVPMVNPDGIARAHNSTNYATARKNAHGVDLNRNYAATWGGPGSSSSPGSATYRGPAPASEPETQVMSELLASRNWTFYSSLHSGAEMILWPYGHTTASPAEVAAYSKLGNELTALTSAPNGQVSKILYSVSGDSMDHAYISAGPYWKPLATSPETYQGSGSASDWWFLFNPPDAEIGSIVARWTAFLDHLAKEAAHYAPAKLTAPSGFTGPGAPFTLAGSVETPLKRPFLSSDATLAVPSFLSVASANPIPIGALNGTRPLEWDLTATSGGAGPGSMRVNAGPAGNISATFPIVITAPAIALTVSPTSVGSGQNFTATVRATSDVDLAGTATLVWQGATVDERPVALAAGGEAIWTVTLNAGDAPPGSNPVVASLVYSTPSDTGAVAQTQAVFVDRPHLAPSRLGVPAESTAGDVLPMSVILRNTGTRGAINVTLRETLPTGYAPWLRSASVLDPISRPMPTRASVADDGRIVLEWDLPLVSPGGNFRVDLALRPMLAGEHELASAFTYRAQYASSTYSYAGALRTAHAVGVPGGD